MYKITQILNDVKGKFACMVSFDGRKEERYEVESLDPLEIDAVLTKVDSEVASMAEEVFQEVPLTKDGQVDVALAISLAEAINVK